MRTSDCHKRPLFLIRIEKVAPNYHISSAANAHFPLLRLRVPSSKCQSILLTGRWTSVSTYGSYLRKTVVRENFLLECALCSWPIHRLVIFQGQHNSQSLINDNWQKFNEDRYRQSINMFTGSQAYHNVRNTPYKSMTQYKKDVTPVR